MPQPLVLRLLGPVRITGIERPLTSQQLALVTYLACVGPASRPSVIDAIWDGKPVSDGRFANLVSEVRRALGRHHLPELQADRYRLSGISTDLDLLVGLTRSVEPDAARSTPSTLAALEAAIGLVTGPVFAAPVERCWRWLDGHPEVVAGAEAEVGLTADRLVTVLRNAGELDRAREVCQRVLAWYPLDRDLILALEAVHRAQGRPGAAHRLVAGWRLQVQRLTGEDPLAADAA